jgi:DeoR/GlpR family transcriptional regulator of sugar metabolism
MFERCRRLVLLCDSTKLGKTCFYSMGDVADIDDIITEGELPEKIVSRVGERRKLGF